MSTPRAKAGKPSGDGGHVLHFERERPGRFDEDDACVRTHLRGDASTDQRVVVRDVHAESGELIVTESPRRAINAIGDKNVVALGHDGEQRQRDGRKAGRHRERPVSAFERGESLLQIGHGRQAVQAVHNAGILAATRGVEISHAREHHGRCAIDRGVDRAKMLARRATEPRHLGGGFECFAVAHSITSSFPG
jgi:hypothetical protein